MGAPQGLLPLLETTTQNQWGRSDCIKGQRSCGTDVANTGASVHYSTCLDHILPTTALPDVGSVGCGPLQCSWERRAVGTNSRPRQYHYGSHLGTEKPCNHKIKMGWILFNPVLGAYVLIATHCFEAPHSQLLPTLWHCHRASTVSEHRWRNTSGF